MDLLFSPLISMCTTLFLNCKTASITAAGGTEGFLPLIFFNYQKEIKNAIKLFNERVIQLIITYQL